MKKVFGLKSLFMGLLLLGAFLVSSSRVEAQTKIGGYNWKPVDQAKPALIDAMTVVKQDVANLPAGPSLNEAKAHLYYYMSIHASIQSGNTVETAVFTSLNMFPDDPATPPADAIDVVVSPAYKQVLFQDAVSILTQ